MLPVRAVSRSLLKGNVMESTASNEQPVIGEAQAFCAKVLTAEVLGLIDSGVDSGVSESKAKRKAENHLKKLGDLLYANGVKWYMVTRKAPKGITETPEDEVQRAELVRQIEDRMTKRMVAKNPEMGAHVAFDLDGALKGINEARQKAGKSKLTAREATVDYGDIISTDMLDNRDSWSNVKSVYFGRLDKYLKKHEPKADDTETGDSQETGDTAPARTPEQNGILHLIEAHKYFAKSPASEKVDATIHVLIELLASWGEKATADSE